MSEDRDALLDTTVIHDGRVVHLSIDRVRFPDGSEGELELVRHRGAAAVLPVVESGPGVDPEVLLLRQYRYAAGGVIYEVPAGIIEPGRLGDCAGELEGERGAGRRLVKRRRIIQSGFTNEQITSCRPSI